MFRSESTTELCVCNPAENFVVQQDKGTSFRLFKMRSHSHNDSFMFAMMGTRSKSLANYITRCVFNKQVKTRCSFRQLKLSKERVFPKFRNDYKHLIMMCSQKKIVRSNFTDMSFCRYFKNRKQSENLVGPDKPENCYERRSPIFNYFAQNLRAK